MAFDGLMNLVMRDVEEEYTVLLRIKRTMAPRDGAEATSGTAPSAGAEHSETPVSKGPAQGGCAAATDDKDSRCAAATDDRAKAGTPVTAGGIVTGGEASAQAASAVTAVAAGTAADGREQAADQDDAEVLIFRTDWKQGGVRGQQSPASADSEQSLASALSASDTDTAAEQVVDPGALSGPITCDLLPYNPTRNPTLTLVLILTLTQLPTLT